MDVVAEECIKYKCNYRPNNFQNFDGDQLMPAGEKDNIQKALSNLSSSQSTNILLKNLVAINNN